MPGTAAALAAAMTASSRRCHQRRNLVERLVGAHPVGQRLVAQDEAVSQAVVHDGAHVIGRDEALAVEPGAHARAAVQREAAARAGADLEPFAQGLSVAAREPRRASKIACCGIASIFAPPLLFAACAFSSRLSFMISPSVSSSGYVMTTCIRKRSICASGSG